MNRDREWAAEFQTALCTSPAGDNLLRLVMAPFIAD